jgi:branched-chain amino acid transport system ATP-binding protein
VSALLEIADLHVRYGAVHAVRGISVTIPEGEVHALLGGNGAGKSSLLRAVLGVVRKEGRVVFAGTDISTMPPHEIVRAGVGFCPQGRDVFGSLTVRENLELGAHSRGIRGAEFSRALDRILELFPSLATRLGQRAGTLSGGEQQMLSIGRALVSSPRLLLLDEPTSALSPRACDDLVETLNSLKSTHMTIVVVEQNVEYALRIADRAYVLAFGEVARQGNTAKLREDPQLLEAYLGLTADARQG